MTHYQLTLDDQRRRIARPRVVVSFAGIGGTCLGLERAGMGPSDAINHSRIALAIHRANHPLTRHHIEDVYKVRPIVGTQFFWLSPDCTHHSRAKQGKPKSGKSIRSGASRFRPFRHGETAVAKAQGEHRAAAEEHARAGRELRKAKEAFDAAFSAEEP